MNTARTVLRHFLAALAYRTQKAVRDAPDHYADFRIAPGVRTPRELVWHMTSVLGFARTRFVGGSYHPQLLPTLAAELERFHDMLRDLSGHLETEEPLTEGTTELRLLQGPFADAMTHAGQLAMLRRLAGSPVPPENFLAADIDGGNVAAEQARPADPDREWHDAESEPH